MHCEEITYGHTKHPIIGERLKETSLSLVKVGKRLRFFSSSKSPLCFFQSGISIKLPVFICDHICLFTTSILEYATVLGDKTKAENLVYETP